MSRARALASVAWLYVAWASAACSSGGGGSPALPNGAGNGNDGAANDGSTASGGSSMPGGNNAEVPAAPPLTLASIRPEDGASEVALDAVIEIRFSAAVDPATATASSIVVQGPGGTLQGELTVEGEVVRFTPASPLPLLTRIGITLGTPLASSAGGLLAEPLELEFESRDGVFREPQQVHAGAAASLFLHGNAAGDLIATWTDLQVTSSVEAMVLDAELGTWTPAQRIEEDEQLAFSRPVAAMAANGDSIVAWRGGGWTRYAGAWSPATVGAGISLPSVALGADTALSVSNAMMGATYQLLPHGSSEWSAAEPVLPAGRVDAIEALGGGFIAMGTREGELVAAQLSAGGGAWSEPVVLAPVQQLQRLRLATQGEVAGVTWQELGEAPAAEDNLVPVTRSAARLFAAGAWSPALAVEEGAELPWLSVAASGRALAVWTRANAIHASSYAPELGWSEPRQLAEQGELTPVGAVDGAGNLLALWPSSQQIAVQRQAAGGEWQALDPLDSQVTVSLWSHVDQQGRVNLVWQNGSGIWWTRFE